MPNQNLWTLVVATLFLLCACYPASAAYDEFAHMNALPPDVQRLFNQGLLSNGEAGIGQLTQAIQLAPKSAELYKYRGDKYVRMENWNAAYADYSKAIELEPGYLDALSARGEASYKQKQYQKAIPDLLKAIDFTKESSGTDDMKKLALLECLATQKQYAKIVELSDTALKFHPWSAIYDARAKAFLALGQNRKAYDDCIEGQKLDPEYVGFGPTQREAMKRLGMPISAD